MSAIPEPATALRDALRSGEVSAVEATEHFLNRIAERPGLGTFIEVTAETALREARVADTRFAHATPEERRALPPLHGMPIAHKDLVQVEGSLTTYGSAALPAVRATEDSPGVAVLRTAGAISLGKTQVPELGLNAYSENLIAPPARNPHDLSRTPGGSSGGSAAAVAAGLLPVAPGSDGGGSVRIPALACGLIGLKPGLGAVPTDLAVTVPGAGRSYTAPGDPEISYVDAFGAPRLAVSGPIARTVADAAMLFDVMSTDAMSTDTGGVSTDTGSTEAAVARADALTGLRIGISLDSPFNAAHPTPLSPDAHEAWLSAARTLEERGHHIEQAEFAYDERYPEVFGHAWMAGLSMLELPDEAVAQLTEFTRFFRARALARPREAHIETARTLTEIAADFRAQWGEYDVVLTPGIAAIPPVIGAFTSLSPEADYLAQCEWTPFTSMVNVAGLPAITVPTLTLPGGLTLGAQLIGRRGAEAQLLQLAQQLVTR